MAKNFGRAASARTFDKVSRISGERANIITLKMIHTDDLIDYPENREDISDTADIENSIRELGFTDPLEVCPHGEDGRYMIVSGHRRRAAGVKAGVALFPCLVRQFESDGEIKNYVLLSNSQRDSSKDPLLYCKRYKMHEQYLRESGFEGSIREEIAKRLGISVQQADRYNQFNKIILPVWDMVRYGLVGMSSVLPMAVHTAQEQEEIYELLREHVGYGGTLNREVCDRIIKQYRSPHGEDVVGSTPRSAAKSPHGEDIVGSTPRSATKNPHGEDIVGSTPRSAAKNPHGEDRDGKSAGRQLEQFLRGIKTGGEYVFEDESQAEETMRAVSMALTAVIDELYNIGVSYNKAEVFKEIADNIKGSVKRYRGK